MTPLPTNLPSTADELIALIQSISTENTITIPSDIHDYINELLSSAQESFESLEELRETLDPFLIDAGVVESIIDTAFTQLAINKSTNNGNNDDDAVKKISNIDLLDLKSVATALESTTLTNSNVTTSTSTSTTTTKSPRRPRGNRHQKSSEDLPDGPSSSNTTTTLDLLDLINATTQSSRFHVDTLTTLSNDIDIPGVNITIGDSNELLVDTRLKLMSGVHYGLIGANGIGKTTLMKCIGYNLLPGFPASIRVLYVEQIEGMDITKSLVESVVEADREALRLWRAKRDLEEALETENATKVATCIRQVNLNALKMELEEAKQLALKRSGTRGLEARQRQVELERRFATEQQEFESIETAITKQEKDSAFQRAHDMLQDIYEKLQGMDGGDEESASAKARKILHGLGFAQESMDRPLSECSSGWQVRVALARALFIQPDVLLLDEPQNFLALDAILWLQHYLNELDVTIVTISHDRCFLNAVAQEIILFKDKTLTYYQGNYDTFEETRAEKQKHGEKMKENMEKKKAHLEKTIQESIAYAKKTGDDKKLGLAASRKKKLEDRMGVERSAHGHRFKLNRDLMGYHLTKRADASSMVDTAEEIIDWSFPDPEPLRHQGPLVQLEGVSFRYGNSSRWVLQDVTLNILPNARISLVGNNGQGKSTLTGLIAGSLQATKGTISRHPQAKIGFYTQAQVESLSQRSDTALTYLQQISTQLNQNPIETKPLHTEHELRAHLSRYGIKNATAAHQPLCTLSGGQLVRVAVAGATLHHPHLLILDEVSAHLSLETVSELKLAMEEFTGAIVLVSHDQWLVGAFGGECYLVENGIVRRLERGVKEYVEKVEKDFRKRNKD